MALGLHPECQGRLREVIAEHLPHIRVTHRMFLDRSTSSMLFLAEPIVPQSGPIRDKLEKYIGEFAAAEFFIEKLSLDLRNQKYDENSESQPIVELEGYGDATKVAGYLVDELESLPWTYSLTIKLENDFSALVAKAINAFSLSDSTHLVTPNNVFIDAFPITGAPASSVLGFGSLSTLFGGKKWDDKSAYLQISEEGFVGAYADLAPVERAILKLKSFCGLSIALRLLKVNRTNRAWAWPVKLDLLIHRKIGTGWELCKATDIGTEMSETIQDLVINDLDGALQSEESKVAWIRSALDQISCVFRSEPKSSKLLLASQWLFDSYCGKNDLLAFVQTAVAMEILLGDKNVSDLLGLGELLRNRCAYLIGKSHVQREGILADFKKIYEVRSKIVHRGKSQLTADERTLFDKLRWMCRRVIYEEMNLLQQDLAAEKKGVGS